MTQCVFNAFFCFMSKFHFDTPMGQIGTTLFIYNTIVDPKIRTIV